VSEWCLTSNEKHVAFDEMIMMPALY